MCALAVRTEIVLGLIEWEGAECFEVEFGVVVVAELAFAELVG